MQLKKCVDGEKISLSYAAWLSIVWLRSKNRKRHGGMLVDSAIGRQDPMIKREH